MVHTLFYFCLMFFLKNKTQLYVVKRELRPRKMFYFSWCLVLFNLFLMKEIFENGIFSNWISFSVFVLLGVSSILVFYVFYLIIKTRGYLFESGTFFSSWFSLSKKSLLNFQDKKVTICHKVSGRKASCVRFLWVTMSGKKSGTILTIFLLILKIR